MIRLPLRNPTDNEKILAGLSHFRNFTEEELDDLFSKMDYNNDGTIAHREFKAAIYRENFNCSMDYFAKKESSSK